MWGKALTRRLGARVKQQANPRGLPGDPPTGAISRCDLRGEECRPTGMVVVVGEQVGIGKL